MRLPTLPMKIAFYTSAFAFLVWMAFQLNLVTVAEFSH